MSKYEGVVCVLKPPGMSSSDAVTDVRRIFGEKRVGHTGTLDPAAAGVLPICIGRATRLFDFLVDKQKTYIAEIVFGMATDTEDATGKVVETSEKQVDMDSLIGILPHFIGRIEQTPPAYSALNVNGVKLYKLARNGQVTETPEIKKRIITVFGIRVIKQIAPNRFLIEIICSKGTYIRTLCKDIGLALGAPAHMAFLLRSASGAFELNDCSSIAELEKMRAEGLLLNVVIPMDKAVSNLPEIRLYGLSEKRIDLLIKGTSINVSDVRENIPLRIYAQDEFLGIGSIREGELRLDVWLGDEARQVKGVKLSGVVAEARHVGSTLGFPTANLEGYNKKLLPPEGVYASVVRLEGKCFRAVTSIGTNPTFDGDRVSVETHIIGYEGDCYGKPLTVVFTKWIRPMHKFASREELAERIRLDTEISKTCKESLKYTE